MNAETKANILIVDDNENNLFAMQSALEELGENIVTAISGKRALRLMLDQEFALVLLDVNMPGMDGFEIATLMKQVEKLRRIPIIFITSMVRDEESALKGYLAGAVDYILAPINPYILKLKVAAFVAMQKLIDANRNVEELARLNNLLKEENDERRRAEAELRKTSRQLRALSSHLLAAREEERTCMAREIHDELGQMLAGMKMDISWIESHLGDEDGKLVERTKSVKHLVDETAKTVRRIVSDLRPGVLDTLGLAAAVEWLAREFRERTGIECKFIAAAEDFALEQEQATAMFRICQEALTNILRHAQATAVIIRLSRDTRSLALEVRDNGCGLSEDALSKRNSFGLVGMRERARLLGGDVRISGKPGRGTRVIARIPVSPELAMKASAADD